VLSLLVGSWEGTGFGEFPTLAPFTYRERLEISNRGPGVAHYAQETWRSSNAEEARSHIETGFINLSDDGDIEILNAQGSDRVEALTGQWSLNDGVVSFELASAVLAYDDRMIRSWRTLTIADDELSYVMGMATSLVPDGARHLTAALQRCRPPDIPDRVTP